MCPVIMGYGFSLPDNPADHFSIGFSAAIASYINTVKERRSGKKDLTDGSTSNLDQSTPEEITTHWVRIHNKEPESSPNFLEDFSIAIENPRECRYADTSSRTSELNLQDPFVSRNKLHVMCAVLMILQKGQLSIRKHDRYLPEKPQNARQVDAARYRQRQLEILDLCVSNLYDKLRILVASRAEGNGKGRIFKLEDIFTSTPKHLLKDIRSILNTGLKTRDPTKIRERGGIDFAFTIWLCGIWLLHHCPIEPSTDQTSEDVESTPALPTTLSKWLSFLEYTYPFPSTQPATTPSTYATAVQEADRAVWFDPVRNPLHDECRPTNYAHPTNSEGESIAEGKCYAGSREAKSAAEIRSYVDAVKATVEKHPNSIFNDDNVNRERLAWCLESVRAEGVWMPDLRGGEMGEGDGDDEWVLLIEDGDRDQAKG